MKDLIVPDINYQEEIKKCKTMEDHLGREKYERVDYQDRNYRNGYSSKNVRSRFGAIDLGVPRDRNSNFEPKVVKKYETVCNELGKKIIGLYAYGMSVRDIQSEMEELYGIYVSPSMISKITDKVVGAAAEWQSRMLDEVYPIVYMDAMHLKLEMIAK